MYTWEQNVQLKDIRDSLSIGLSLFINLLIKNTLRKAVEGSNYLEEGRADNDMKKMNVIINKKGLYKADYYKIPIEVVHMTSKEPELRGYYHEGEFLTPSELCQIFDIVIECVGGRIDCYDIL